MGGDQTSEFRDLFDRMRHGDEAARQELIAGAYEQLHRLVAKIFHESFPRLRNLHETDSVLDEAVLRLLKALQEMKLASAADFFRFSATIIRHTLLDMTRRQKRRKLVANVNFDGGDSEVSSPNEPGETTHDPAKLALWTEFHERVDSLPAEEREVVDLCFYQGLTQAEAARVLGIHPREVSRRWTRAVRKLPDCPL